MACWTSVSAKCSSQDQFLDLSETLRCQWLKICRGEPYGVVAASTSYFLSEVGSEDRRETLLSETRWSLYCHIVFLGKKPSRCPLCNSSGLPCHGPPPQRWRLNSQLFHAWDWNWLWIGQERPKSSLTLGIRNCCWKYNYLGHSKILVSLQLLKTHFESWRSYVLWRLVTQNNCNNCNCDWK